MGIKNGTPFGNPKLRTFHLRVRSRATMRFAPMEGRRDVRLGDDDAAEALFGPRDVEAGQSNCRSARPTLAGQPDTVLVPDILRDPMPFRVVDRVRLACHRPGDRRGHRGDFRGARSCHRRSGPRFAQAPLLRTTQPVWLVIATVRRARPTNSTCVRRLPVGGHLGESELGGKRAPATGRRANGSSMFEGRGCRWRL